MRKRVLTLLGGLCLVALLFTLAFAAEGNPRKGKFLYRKHCKTCHEEGGSAKALGPDAKTMAQWERVFEPDNIADLECADEWAKLSDSDVNDIFAFLHGGALDSPSPAKCE